MFVTPLITLVIEADAEPDSAPIDVSSGYLEPEAVPSYTGDRHSFPGQLVRLLLPDHLHPTFPGCTPLTPAAFQETNVPVGF